MAASRGMYKATLRTARANAAIERSPVYVEAVAPNYVVVASFTPRETASNADGPYKVLIGAELSVDHVGITAVEVECEPYDGRPVVFKHVSPRSLLGPPYRVAVACTCLDWKLRSGFSQAPPSPGDLEEDEPTDQLDDRASFCDAGAGCKHMMLCNSAILHQTFVTLGPSVRSEQNLKAFWSSTHHAPEAGAYVPSRVRSEPGDQLQPEASTYESF